MRAGIAAASWTTHKGQAPPKRANCSRVALWRLVMLPAMSTRQKNIGIPRAPGRWRVERRRSEEHTSELQSLMRISYAVFCLKKKKANKLTTVKKKEKVRTRESRQKA